MEDLMISVKDLIRIGFAHPRITNQHIIPKDFIGDYCYTSIDSFKHEVGTPVPLSRIIQHVTNVAYKNGYRKGVEGAQASIREALGIVDNEEEDY